MKYRIIPVTNFYQNCSLIWCEKTQEGALFDPGGEINRIKKEIEKIKIRITKILLTHGHIDHIGGALELSNYYSIPIIGPHIDDRILFDQISTQCNFFGWHPLPTFIPNRWLYHEDQIKIGCENFTILHCPGHSPGHIVFWNKNYKLIIMGDVLFKESIGRTDLPGGDKQSLLQSISYLLSLEDNITFLPGHGEKSTLNHERYNNPFVINLINNPANN
ncbi:MBL fold metallo-hydrolase [Candidatus Schneideria nysicola]|uniref:MBL fold metallo-hydrolase n=1 Tax=Candidatus Schneideria nysicola TaxID=1081631 RepID=UPI001CAA7FBF|nr:MBL fold metallo-hydrolase [Candidatus Schneideria nysicola]UAJ66324.1 MBL fold metallo-hydrolase [Candidatus Schneideria nysicola]